ncbi:MAG: His/Gly/Thr/Pro-type tRNA ligase C-terminal domain-containing protein, partial [Candidatus Thorarchaeota archaeon]|nr:His/Gly/Thr/Pro-type tRNA ligase C-terminal domain-containing protein [Candidatus Thorarchaeota archaeon]
HECFRSIDKLDKIGKKGVLEELNARGISAASSETLIDALEIRGSGLASLDEFADLLKGSEMGMEGVEELQFMAEIFDEADVSQLVEFDMSLARGLDYYTGPVFEGRYLGKPAVGSILGGGRYDHLIGRFGGQATPATGISLGIDRLVDVLLARGVAKELGSQLDVFIAPIKKPMVKYAAKIANKLAQSDISVEMDLMERSLKKLFARSDERGAKFTVIIGERDIEKGEVSVRNMQSKETAQVKLEDVVDFLASSLGA